MKVLLSSWGTRGDVQPFLALAFALRARGHDSRLCVAPNFKSWVESLGFACVSMGEDIKELIGPAQRTSSEEQQRQRTQRNVSAQFEALAAAAPGCSMIVGNSIAACSVAEALEIPYIFAAGTPVALPSPDHPPPKRRAHHPQTLSRSANLALWAQKLRIWNDLFFTVLNEERVKLGLAAVENVQQQLITGRPWLATDPILGPPGAATDMEIVHTGAWLMPDPSPLPEPVERFLADGEPPVYLGFGSMRAAEECSPALIESVRALGLRLIVSRGWANLAPVDERTDCLSIGDVAHEKLLPRVSAVVHHGGAGTTTAAARAGKPQVIVPHEYDQPYWAHRVQELGVGVAGPTSESLTVQRLVDALRECLRPEVKTRAQLLGPRIQLDGAQQAAARIEREFG